MQFSRLRFKWLAWQRVIVTLNRIADLGRLVKWANRKGLPGPESAYRFQLDRAEQRLEVYSSHFPRLVRWARFLRWLNALLNPPPRYWPKGSASKYKLRTG